MGNWSIHVFHRPSWLPPTSHWLELSHMTTLTTKGAGKYSLPGYLGGKRTLSKTYLASSPVPTDAVETWVTEELQVPHFTILSLTVTSPSVSFCDYKIKVFLFFSVMTKLYMSLWTAEQKLKSLRKTSLTQITTIDVLMGIVPVYAFMNKMKCNYFCQKGAFNKHFWNCPCIIDKYYIDVFPSPEHCVVTSWNCILYVFHKFWTKYLLMHFSVQFSRSVVSDSLRPHELQHTRPPCPTPAPGAQPNSCPLSRWCHPTVSSSVIPFSSCPQSYPAFLDYFRYWL